MDKRQTPEGKEPVFQVPSCCRGPAGNFRHSLCARAQLRSWRPCGKGGKCLEELLSPLSSRVKNKEWEKWATEGARECERNGGKWGSASSTREQGGWGLPEFFWLALPIRFRWIWDSCSVQKEFRNEVIIEVDLLKRNTLHRQSWGLLRRWGDLKYGVVGVLGLGNLIDYSGGRIIPELRGFLGVGPSLTFWFFMVGFRTVMARWVCYLAYANIW